MPTNKAYFGGSAGPALKLSIARDRAARTVLVVSGGVRRRLQVTASIVNAGGRRGQIKLKAVDLGVLEDKDAPPSAWNIGVVDQLSKSKSGVKKLSGTLKHNKAWLHGAAARRRDRYAQAARASATLDGVTISVEVTRGEYGDRALEALSRVR